MKKLTNLMIVLFMVALLTAPLLAYHHGAYHHGMKAKRGGMGMYKCCPVCYKVDGLELTAEQKTKIDKLRKDHFAQREIHWKATEKIRLEMIALMKAEAPDKAAIDKKIEEQGKLRIEWKKASVGHQFKIFSVLTDEQKKTWSENNSFLCGSCSGCGKMGRKGMKGHGRSGGHW